jgi:phage shock protein A
MSLLNRIVKIGHSKLTEIVEHFETPEFLVDDKIKQKRIQLRELKSAVQSISASERQLKIDLNQASIAKTEWEQKAEKALLVEDEDLALKALSRVSDYESNVDSIEKSWQSQTEILQSFKNNILNVESELSSLEREREILLAHSTLKDAQSIKNSINLKEDKQLEEEIDSLSTKPSQALQDKLEQMKAKMKANSKDSNK